MKKLFILLLFLIPFIGFSQSNSNDQVFLAVEQMPQFPGGDAKLFEYLQSNVAYPPEARTNGVEGTVYVSFVISRDGSVEDIKVLKSVDSFLDTEAIRVIASMPKWKPGYQNGKLAKVQYQVPIKFKITEPAKKNK